MKKEHKSKLSAIMCTDIVGYSQKMKADEQAALTLLEKYNSLIFPQIDKYEGKIVKTIGDALLLDFHSARSACSCAFNIQQTLAEYNRTVADKKQIYLRIGIHLGDVWYTENDLLGEEVIIASQLVALAPPGGICISQAVHGQLAHKLDYKFTPLGPKYLKDINHTTNAYWLHTGIEAEVADDKKEQQFLKNKIIKEQEMPFGSRKQENVRAANVNDNPASIFKNKFFTVINTYMDKAIKEWNKAPQKRKNTSIRKKIREERWFEHWEHRKERRLRKKGGIDDIIVGLVATAGFGFAFIYFNLWWMIFPLVFVGVIPLLTGFSKLFTRRSSKKTLQISKADREKQVLRVANDSKGIITVLQVANNTDLSIEEARETLDNMVKKGYANLNVDDNGILRYEFLEFQA